MKHKRFCVPCVNIIHPYQLWVNIPVSTIFVGVNTLSFRVKTLISVSDNW